MTSQNASITAKQPQRERGRQRVAALLDAAATLFAAKGFEATTMTGIAAQAGASIGSLYQFFPTKEHVADAILTEHAADLHLQMSALAARANSLSLQETGSQLFAALIEFRAAHPAFAVLVEARGAPFVRASGIRQRLREQVLDILRRKAPAISDEELTPIAIAILQIMKAAVALNGETDLPQRDAALQALREMLLGWIKSRLGPATS
ncbi:TetR/AcrR family transcriptional regulator [Silvimonas sp.]|uniref:TetR/AcrR family transcriptional regulator n=1 Tax=Silvimonas sp. TaxID=2650811 RepID=UPI00283E9C7F|nr:TetR/AcrR family transcriptional regulator [Silvimonas sp.]MDR3429519.1 TetR/AcrR family transcriptional regulator [Silvimonas sp.]